MLVRPTGTSIAKTYGGPMGYRRRAPAQTVRRRVNLSAGWYKPLILFADVGFCPCGRHRPLNPSRHTVMSRHLGTVPIRGPSIDPAEYRPFVNALDARHALI